MSSSTPTSSSSSSSSSSHDETDNIIQSFINHPNILALPQLIKEKIETLQSTASSSRSRRRRHVERNREFGNERLIADYFAENPTFFAEVFRRRFRMRRDLFLRIVDQVTAIGPFFQQRRDGSGRLGLSPLQKCTAAIRMLAYGVPADAVDDYVRIGESTAIQCLKRFCQAVCGTFKDEYLRRPNHGDVQRLLYYAEARVFPGMLGSIDCMHLSRKNCPAAWKGQYTNGYKGTPSIILEAVAGPDLWIWHAFFGVAGVNNDINVLDRSHVFDDVLKGIAPKVNFMVNGNSYTSGYYLTDGIYPEYSTFVKSIPHPMGAKRKLFAERQESFRKDVERAFGVLQARFAIVRGPARLWHSSDLGNIMRACIIMHNMIVEDERDTYVNYCDISAFDEVNDTPSQPNLSQSILPEYANYVENYTQNLITLRNKSFHRQLQANLIEHIWHFNNSE